MRKEQLRWIVLTGLTLSAVFLGGCGENSGLERVTVSGTVSYNGKPVSEGMIRFVPDKDSPVPTAAASIKDGKYEIDSHGGVPVGTYEIQIQAFHTSKATRKRTESVQAQFGGDTIRKQYLPAKFNSRTKLEITIPPDSREITKNFDLTN